MNFIRVELLRRQASKPVEQAGVSKLAHLAHVLIQLLLDLGTRLCIDLILPKKRLPELVVVALNHITTNRNQDLEMTKSVVELSCQVHLSCSKTACTDVFYFEECVSFWIFVNFVIVRNNQTAIRTWQSGYPSVAKGITDESLGATAESNAVGQVKVVIFSWHDSGNFLNELIVQHLRNLACQK